LIESITIKNLRGIRQCTVNNLTHINIFIGKNGAGKSTILEAIYLASSWAQPKDQIRDTLKHEYVISRSARVLIEDPEAHQHPGGLATFTRFAFKTAKKQRLQLFITTHSIELLNIAKEISKELGLGLRIYYMERGKDGYVDVRAIEEPDLETLQKIGLDPRMLHIL
jgi:AAA15 family ATPase/GTPase